MDTHEPSRSVIYDVIIIGGGPGGSVAGIVLARAGLRVALLEKEVFPRDKLCGEFLSGEGYALLKSLGLGRRLSAVGAASVGFVVVTGSKGGRYRGAAPGGAISISRFRLDMALLDEARASGVDVFDGEAARRVEGELSSGFVVRSNGSEIESRAVVCAAGRHGRVINQIRGGRGRPGTRRMVAFKTHYSGPMPPGRVELHAFMGGYCGVQRVENDLVNICWLSRASVLREAGGSPDSMLEYMQSQNRALRRRLERLRPRRHEFLAASPLDFSPRGPVASDVLMVGDSAGMIAPMCGDGMAMAMHSGALAASHLEGFLTGTLPAADLLAGYASAWKRSFLPRMRLARLLEVGMEREEWCSIGIKACNTLPALGQWLIRKSRG